MKKIAGIIICITLLSALMCMFTSAQSVTLYPDTNGAYDVEYQGTANNYYVVLVVSGTYAENQAPTISEETILYIDQVTAGSDGTALFEDFKLKPTSTPTDATVYIGGSDIQSATLYGYIPADINQSIVSGTVNTVSKRQATVTLTDVDDSTRTYSVSTSGGTFEIAVDPAKYTMSITCPGHLSYTKNSLDATSNVNTINVTLRGGDVKVDSNSKIDFDDLMVVLNNYGKQTSSGDVNGNGSIDFDDLMSVLNNYQHTATIVD